jgi:hypothetical protein
VTSLESALHRIAAGLARSHVDFALVGGLAVSVRTEPRFTRDADRAVAVTSDAEAEALIRLGRTNRVASRLDDEGRPHRAPDRADGAVARRPATSAGSGRSSRHASAATAGEVAAAREALTLITTRVITADVSFSRSSIRCSTRPTPRAAERSRSAIRRLAFANSPCWPRRHRIGRRRNCWTRRPRSRLTTSCSAGCAEEFLCAPDGRCRTRISR